jgi:hypothetical protein
MSVELAAEVTGSGTAGPRPFAAGARRRAAQAGDLELNADAFAAGASIADALAAAASSATGDVGGLVVEVVDGALVEDVLFGAVVDGALMEGLVVEVVEVVEVVDGAVVLEFDPAGAGRNVLAVGAPEAMQLSSADAGVSVLSSVIVNVDALTQPLLPGDPGVFSGTTTGPATPGAPR